MRRRDELSDDDAQFLERLCRASSEVHTVYALAQDFTQLGRKRQAEALEAWLRTANGSGVEELQSFVAGIERDKAAVPGQP